MTGNDSSEAKITEIYELISSVNKEAYKDVFLISNHVLSKNPFNNNLINRYLKNEDPRPARLHALIGRFSSYYIKSLLHFVSYLFKFAEHFLSSYNFSHPRNGKEIVIIDVFFLMERIIKSKTFKDFYFPGLEDALKKKKSRYAYLPYFYSPAHNKKPLELYDTLRILKKGGLPVITEYQLLKPSDLMSLAGFIITYPFHVLRLVRRLRADSYAVRLLKHELMDTIGCVTFYNFSRYLQGKRINELPYESIKMISWYENQAIHKNLYKGLRTGAVKSRIYGAKLSIYSRNLLSEIPDEKEAALGLVPDKIITNGPYFIPPKTTLNYQVGPSLRYSKIYETALKRENQKNILVLLPYIAADVQNILQILLKTKIGARNILIKPHPAISIEKYRRFILPGARLVNEDMYKLFEETKIAIGAASGTLVEAASLGIPVISVRNPERFDYDNSLPEYGKGIIWEDARDAEELINRIEMFEKSFDDNAGKIKIIAEEYKKMFFSPITEQGIKEAFEL